MLTQGAAAALIDYKLWADELTFDHVIKLPTGEARRERPTLFKSIIGTLNHIYVVDLIWRSHLEGREHGFTSRKVILHDDIAQLRDSQRACNEWFKDWCLQQTDATLNEAITFRFIAGNAGRMSRGAIVLHLVNHGTYHRGCVDELSYQVPAEPPTTDLCVYFAR